ncbi:hypothetical protein HDU76_001835 [Blyttiomyces sp. JEL0837]|nr:hypothetical protein HDU76_001835 [Blyttiomyces sp. JEL0837]
MTTINNDNNNNGTEISYNLHSDIKSRRDKVIHGGRTKTSLGGDADVVGSSAGSTSGQDNISFCSLWYTGCLIGNIPGPILASFVLWKYMAVDTTYVVLYATLAFLYLLKWNKDQTSGKVLIQSAVEKDLERSAVEKVFQNDVKTAVYQDDQVVMKENNTTILSVIMTILNHITLPIQCIYKAVSTAILSIPSSLSTAAKATIKQPKKSLSIIAFSSLMVLLLTFGATVAYALIAMAIKMPRYGFLIILFTQLTDLAEDGWVIMKEEASVEGTKLRVEE